MGVFKQDKWPLDRRLYYLRLLQCVIALVNFITSVWITSLVVSRHLGQSGALTISIIMAGLTFIVTLLGNWFGRNFSGYQKRGCVVVFILFDVLCIGMQVPAIATLTVAGVPSNCGGLTSGGSGQAKQGFTTAGFGNGGDSKGQLDKYCGAPRSYFFLSIILIVLFFYTTGLFIRLMALLHRRAKELKAQRKAGKELAQIELGPVTPDPQLAPAETPASVARSPSRQSNSNIVTQERDLSNNGIVAPEATILASSWVARSSNISADPPPYLPDQETVKKSFRKS